MAAGNPSFRNKVQAALYGVLFVPVAAACMLWVPIRIEAQERMDSPESRAVQAETVDADLERRLQSVLRSIDRFKQVEVRVQSGVVRLDGTIGRASDREKIEALLSRFPGVLYVDDGIEVRADAEKRLAVALNLVMGYLRGAASQLPFVLLAAAVVCLFWLIGHMATRWQTPYHRIGRNPLLGNLLRQLIRKGFVLFGLVAALNILDLTAVVGAVLGTAGIVGLAIGFAFKDIIENYLAGVLLSMRSPFTVNDFIQVGPDQGHVMRLTPRELVLMNMEGNHLRIPNSKVFNSILYNFTHNPLRRFDFLVGVGSGEDLAAVARAGCGALRGLKGVLGDPGPFMRVEELGDFCVQVRFHGWMDQRLADFGKVKSEAIRAVKTALDRAGVDMPEPIRRVRLQREPPEGEEERGPAIGPEAIPQEEPPADVGPEDQLVGQIREDQRQSEEPNLLPP